MRNRLRPPARLRRGWKHRRGPPPPRCAGGADRGVRTDPQETPTLTDAASLIAELWTEDGAHILPPPQGIREIAARRSPQRTAQWKASGSSSCSSARTAASGATTSSSRVEHGVARVTDSRVCPGRWNVIKKSAGAAAVCGLSPLRLVFYTDNHPRVRDGYIRSSTRGHARTRPGTIQSGGLQEKRAREWSPVPANTSSRPPW
jgi:hypothetical protein